MQAALILALALLAALPAAAHGASGTITRAEASADWAHGSVAGIVYRTVECLSVSSSPGPSKPDPHPPEWESPPPAEYFSPCAWIPYATVGPGTSQADCSSPGRSLNSPGEGVQVVWSGSERTGVGSAAFDLASIPLDHGAAAPLLCLSVIEAAAQAVICIAVVPSPCPPYAIVGRAYQLDSALLATGRPPESPVEAAPSEPLVGSPQRVEPANPRKARRCRPKSGRRRGSAVGPRVKGAKHGRRRCQRRRAR